ncbi:thioredoxin TrxA [Coxiella endosymbiont of Ornithodoros amblus]|uniref:thioredoxin TrxA n=1 Tax=Coxiella endosymbiont of Ornithodoros amblus TaxID=1656166 RepID=UPI00244E0AA1|nr:thioredoxin TrxA [Coxiella endosymbiont of Ornithodoros amblus]MBW5803066.1 thioredoxin TrxA [Coxiella endosymbiont of Ornithodoros amblus]
MSEYVYTASDENFETEVLQADIPILVDFWAEWCQPCKMISPLVEEIAKEYDGRVKVFKLNVDENAQTPIKYGVRGIPSLLIFRKGEVVDRKVGALNKSQLAAFLDESLHFSS